jgi:hypothetical protein
MYATPDSHLYYFDPPPNSWQAKWRSRVISHQSLTVDFPKGE